jgi:DNA-directed RNA polymerase subunit RPC12/RpoP
VTRIVLPLIILAFALGVNFRVQQRLVGQFDYQCGSCGTQFALTPLAASLAPHKFGGYKYVKCPSCRRRGWAQRVPKGSTS